MDQLLTIKQIAFILKVHHLTVRRYIREKKLQATKIGGSVRVKEADLQNFQKAYTSKTIHLPKKEPVAKTFSFEDPLWKLDGRGASLSLPSD